jgi:antitoxin component YwqK of YwqJK toxin-antitoxin module
MKKILVLLFSLFISLPIFAEEIIIKLLKGKPVSDVYHQEVDFIDTYTYSFYCHFGVRIKNSTSTDVIIYEISIQTPKNWMQKFSENNFDKESVLQNKGITGAGISYGADFGFTYGFSGIQINSGDTWRPSRGWGPGFIFALKKPLTSNEIDLLAQKYTCSLIEEIEIGLNFNDIDFIKFRDNRDLSDVDLHEFFKVVSSTEKGSNVIGEIAPFINDFDHLDDYGFKFDAWQEMKSETRNEYFENGQIKEESNYKNDKLDGKSTKWYKNGQKKVEMHYIYGKLDGKMTNWHENGQIKDEGNYKDGKFDGKWTSWYENGQMRGYTNFKNDIENGKSMQWYENGQKMDEMNKINGKLDGTLTKWYENGQIMDLVNFKEDVLHGKLTKWYQDGQLKEMVNLKEGILHGEFTKWYKNGQIEFRANFNNGVCINGDC